MFAGTNDGVWRSTDRGATFRRTNFPDAKKQVWCFMVDSRDPKRMLRRGLADRRLSQRRRRHELAQARDARHRQPLQGSVRQSRVMRFAQNPKQPDEIYAALEINGVMRSTDGGETWSDCSDGLIKLAELPHLKSKIVSDTTAEGMLDGHAVTINPADPDAAIVALRMGLFRTADGGKSWQDMEVRRFSPTTYGRDVKASPTEPNTLYAALSVAAASHDGGLYRSEDGGQSWKRFDKVQVHGTIMSIGLHAERSQAGLYRRALRRRDLRHAGRRQDLAGHAAARRGPAHLLGGLRVVSSHGPGQENIVIPSVARDLQATAKVPRSARDDSLCVV